MAVSCGASWVPVWDPDARCFAWRGGATGALTFYEADVVSGDVGATGVCEAGAGVRAGVRSDDVCVVAHVSLALLDSIQAHAFDSDAVLDVGSGALDEVTCAEGVPVDPVFLSFAAKRALFEAPVPDDEDDDADDGEAGLDDVTVSVSFLDGSAASFVFAQQPEEHELRSCVYAEFALGEDTVDVVFTQCGHVLEPLAFVDPDGPVGAVKRSVGAGGDCRSGSALPCELTPCCQRHREFRLF